MTIWTIETCSAAVDDALEALPVDVTVRLSRYFKQAEDFGPSSLPPRTVKYLEGKLWELRLTGRDGIARLIYIIAVERRIVLLRAFVKKSQKIPLRDLEIARARA